MAKGLVVPLALADAVAVVALEEAYRHFGENEPLLGIGMALRLEDHAAVVVAAAAVAAVVGERLVVGQALVGRSSVEKC